MADGFDALKDLKCLSCVHATVCANNLGGADLDLVSKDCVHYRSEVEPLTLPTKFYIVFNVPGFYNITEYEVERVSFLRGALDKMWGISKHGKDVAYASDIGYTVFFTREAAELGMKKLIEEYRSYAKN